MRRPRALSIGICLTLAALVAGCAGDRMSRSTEEAVDDSLLANIWGRWRSMLTSR